MMKVKILFMLLVLFSVNSFADSRWERRYQMYFYPSPNDGSCELVEIKLKPFIVKKNTYGYPLKKPDFNTGNITLRKQSDGNFRLQKLPYEENQTWDIFYTYKKKGGFKKFKILRGVVENIPEGMATIYLSCGKYRILEKIKRKTSEIRQHPKIKGVVDDGKEIINRGQNFLKEKWNKYHPQQ